MSRPTSSSLHSARRLALVFAATSLPSYVLPSYAQQTAPKLEEILVTGDPMQRSSLETVGSVSIISADTLEDMNVRDLYDLLLRSPNLNAAREDKFSVRGISNEGIGPGGTGRPTVSVFIDGARQPGRGVGNTWDVKQVEFYRGPQSTAFGPGSLAGAVVIQSEAPSTEAYSGKLKLGVSNYDGREAGVAIGGPIVGDLAFRYAAETNQSDGEVTNTTLNDDAWQARKRYMQRLKLAWAGSDWYSAMFTLQDSKLREGNEYQSPELAPRDEASDNVDGYYDDNSTLAVLTQSADLTSALSLSLILSGSNNHNIRKGDYDISAEEGGYFVNEVESENRAAELRLQLRTDSLKGVAGIYMARDELVGTSESVDLPYELAPGVRARADAGLVAERKADTRAVYAEGDWDFARDWTLTLGLRYEENEADSRSAFIVRRARAIDPITGTTLPVDLSPALKAVLDSEAQAPSGDSVLLPKLALSYQINDSLSTFVAASQGYRAGSVDFVSEGESPSYGPEYTNNYDWGLKWQSPGLSAQLTAFFIDYSDMQIGVRVDAANFRTDNAGRAESRGLELEFNGELGHGFSVFGGLGYVDTEFTEYEDDGVNFAGNRFPNAPRHNASAGLAWASGDGFFANINWSFAQDSYTDRENTEGLKADSRRLLGARLGYRGEHYGIELFGKNLSDEFYITDRFYSESLGIDALYVGDPREYGLRLSYEF